jgi:hypothetical protein
VDSLKKIERGPNRAMKSITMPLPSDWYFHNRSLIVYLLISKMPKKCTGNLLWWQVAGGRSDVFPLPNKKRARVKEASKSII